MHVCNLNSYLEYLSGFRIHAHACMHAYMFICLFVCLLINSLVEEAMGGQYLNSNFSLPCPPGLDIAPEKVNPLTSNSLKVMLPYY